jgi:hypothetical protein
LHPKLTFFINNIHCSDVPLLKRSLFLWKLLNENRVAQALARKACKNTNSNADEKPMDDAESIVTDNDDEGDDSLLKMTGGIMIGSLDSEVIQGTMKSVKEHNLLHEVLDAQEIRMRYPLFNVSPDDIGPLSFSSFSFSSCPFLLIIHAIAQWRVFTIDIVTKVSYVNLLKNFLIFFFFCASTIGIYENDAGYLVPESCVDSHLIEAAANTAELHFGETVLSWSLYTPTTPEIDVNEGNGNTRRAENEINGENKSLRADDINHKLEDHENIFQVHTQDANGNLKTNLTKKIVIAAGPWAPELYGDEISTSLLMHAERRVQLWFEPKTNKELFKVFDGY